MPVRFFLDFLLGMTYAEIDMPNESIGFECLRPISSHASLIYEWLHAAETVSFLQSPEWDVFEDFFQKVLFHDPSLPPIIIQFERQRIAFLWLNEIAHPVDDLRSCAQIFLFVSPAFKEQGYTRFIIKELPEFALVLGVDDLYAEIPKENVLAIQAFEQSGFQKIGEKDHIYRFLHQEIE